MPLRKRIERAAGRVGLRLLVTPLRAMPLSWAQSVGRALGTVLFHVLGPLSPGRAEKPRARLWRTDPRTRSGTDMAKAVFRHFGTVAAEFVKMPQLSREAWTPDDGRGTGASLSTRWNRARAYCSLPDISGTGKYLRVGSPRTATRDRRRAPRERPESGRTLARYTRAERGQDLQSRQLGT